MTQFLLGALAALAVNILTILGWWYIGPWIPAAANALLSLIILGIYGLEDRWAFPGGYWAVQILFIVGWMAGLGALLQLAA